MPVYVYECEKCNERFEFVQKINDPQKKHCPACKGKLKKVFLPIGIVFKGSGFYKTDSRDGKCARTTKEKATTATGTECPAVTECPAETAAPEKPVECAKSEVCSGCEKNKPKKKTAAAK